MFMQGSCNEYALFSSITYRWSYERNLSIVYASGLPAQRARCDFCTQSENFIQRQREIKDRIAHIFRLVRSYQRVYLKMSGREVRNLNEVLA